MNFTLTTHRLHEIKADALVLAVDAGWKSGEVARLDKLLDGVFVAEMEQQGFAGKEAQVGLYQTHGALPARNVLLVAVGTGAGEEPWYKLADTLITYARTLKASHVALAVPAEMLSPAVLERIIEGVSLATYTFTQLKSPATEAPAGPQQLTITHASGAEAPLRAALHRGRTVAAATCYARDLINLPAAIVTPTYLAAEARRIARRQTLRVRILDPRGMQRAGMGALLGVAQGSVQPPRFIELIHQPAGRARRCIALAGKGITFDSGGLSLKPAEAMQAQKRDMAGGAAVLAVMSAIRDLGVEVEVRAYVPASENMPGGRALKPGDVVRACNGKSIEVLNTDAEGRLVLADALAYAAATKPDVLIDLATLTGAVRTALGTRYAAIMGTDATVVQDLITTARTCGENLWELPLVADYRRDLDSIVADLKNIGEGGAGTIIGGLFLREFTDGLPWAHIDFSSTVMTDKALPCHPRGATGFGVRTLLRYLSSR